MTTTKAHHVLVATEYPPASDWHAWDGCNGCKEDPNFKITVECPGVEAGGCNLWSECEVDDPHDQDQVEETGEAHGVAHLMFDGAACVETNECYVQWCVGERGCDDVSEIATAPGRYPVDFETGDPGDIYLTLIPEALAAQR